MNGKNQMISKTENLKKTHISFRTSCKDCKFNGKCIFDANSRMIKKRCYIDVLAEKLRIKPQTVLARCDSVLAKTGSENFSFIPKVKEYGWFDKEEWVSMNNTQRIEEIDYMLNYCSNRLTNDTCIDVVLPTLSDIKTVVAVLNCYFSAWRDEEYIPCAICGEIIKNSKQRNRKYCDDCKVKHKPLFEYGIKTCIDCGHKFEAWHNREIRCFDCQIQANKAKAKERARRYRERKRNGLGRKS